MELRLKLTVLLIVASLTVGTLAGYLSIQHVSYLAVSQARVKELVNSVAADVSAIRGLRFRNPPNVVLISSSEVITTWGREVPEDVLVLGDILVLTLLADPSYNVGESYSRLLGMWLAASAGDTVYVVYDVLDVGDPLTYRVLAHELTHVLQSQYFSLPNPATLDESLALRSLIEGDADLVADTYVELLGLGNVAKITELPLYDPYLALQLVPYVFGRGFVEYLVRLGGWDYLNSVYVNPPRSMKYVMFPSKYVLDEPLAEVEVIVDRVCDRLRTDVLGPTYVYVLVSTYVGRSEALLVAGDWVGDRLVYCTYGGVKEVRWVVKFSSVESAEGLYRLLTNLVALRRGTGYGSGWRVNGLVVTIDVSGDTVVLRSVSVAKDPQQG